jgi:hypothetical protein
MSVEVERRGKSGRRSNRENLPCPGFLFALKSILSPQLFHKSNGDILFSWVRFGGGDGSRHPKIPIAVDKGSGPDKSDAQFVTPHGLSSWKAIALGSAGGCRV